MASANEVKIKTEPNSNEAISIAEPRIIVRKENQDVLFRGAFGGKAVVVKRILLTEEKYVQHEREFKNSLFREGDVQRLGDNVLLYLRCQTINPDYLYVALEYFYCTLGDVIEKNIDDFSIREDVTGNKELVLLQITKGLECLHSLKIPHRDLRPGNIMIVENPSSAETMVKIANMRKGEASPEYLLGGWAGAEFFKGGKKSSLLTSDIFSLGCIYAYVLYDALHPFGEKLKRVGNIVKNITCKKFNNKNKTGDLSGSIDRMIREIPSKRPEISAIKKDISKVMLKNAPLVGMRAELFLELIDDDFLTVCRLFTTLRYGNLNGGDPVALKVQDGPQGTERSHLIARTYGGSGTKESNNIVYMHRDINRVVYREFERYLAEFLKSNPSAVVHVNVIINEDDDASSNLYPTSLRFTWCTDDEMTFFVSPLVENTPEYAATFKEYLERYRSDKKEIYCNVPLGKRIVTIIDFEDDLFKDDTSKINWKYDEIICVGDMELSDEGSLTESTNSGSKFSILHVPSWQVFVDEGFISLDRPELETVDVQHISIPSPRTMKGRLKRPRIPFQAQYSSQID